MPTTEIAPTQTLTATGAELLLDSLQAQGVEYIFANLGTDYPAIVEASARFHQLDRPMPKLVICQHEMVALSAAHGYAALTGKPQAVFVHVDVGTQNLGGSVHNAARARIPAFIFAGMSPWTTRGELPGSRSNTIQYVQDVSDQMGVVRPYMKWCVEMRTPVNVRQVIARAFQVAQTEPAGPVYMMAAREPLEQIVEVAGEYQRLSAPAPSVPADAALRQLLDWISEADFPLLVTSYIGRYPEAMDALVEVAELTGLGVLEAEPFSTNFPTNHAQHCGNTPSPLIAQADLLFLLDTEVPWIPALIQPRADARIAHLDVDPIKPTVPLWDFPAQLAMFGHPAPSLRRMIELLRERPVPTSVVDRRKRKLAEMYAQRQAECQRLEREQASKGKLTAWTVAAAVDRVLDDKGVLVHEAVSNSRETLKYLRRGGQRLLIASGGSALGWAGGASVGAKLAHPDYDVVCLTGDGNFVFGAPTAVFWGARRYNAPFLTVILNNAGWNAVRNATLQQHPEGIASQTGDFTASFEPASDLTLVAKSAGAETWVVDRYETLEGALAEGLAATRRGACALVDVRLDQKV